MLHGDISNHRGYVIGVRCEDCLLHYKQDGVKDTILNAVVGKSKRAELDREVLSLLEYIYWDSDMTIMLIVDDKNYTEELKATLEDLPFNQVGNVKNVSEITRMLNTGELTYYVDSDKIRRSYVNHRYAVDVATMNTLLKRKVRKRD